MDGQPFSKHSVMFDSHGTTCRGVLYRPHSTETRVPGVVLAHGFSGTVDWIVPDVAAKFASGGLAVLIFDYRHSGESGGQPRQLVSARKQREDLLCAVEFMRSCEGVDSGAIALWGTSLGGSHVIEMAARDSSICAVVANVPALDIIKGKNSAAKVAGSQLARRQVLVSTVRLLAAATIDAIKGGLRLAPHYIKVYGPLGEAVFTDPSLADFFDRLKEAAPTWRNRVTPRFLFDAPRYKDGTMERILVPLLVSLARDDVEVSNSFVREKAAKAPRHEIKEYPVGHFQMYQGATFEQVTADQLEFLQRHLAHAKDARAVS